MVPASTERLVSCHTCGVKGLRGSPSISSGQARCRYRTGRESDLAARPRFRRRSCPPDWHGGKGHFLPTGRSSRAEKEEWTPTMSQLFALYEQEETCYNTPRRKGCPRSPGFMRVVPRETAGKCQPLSEVGVDPEERKGAAVPTGLQAVAGSEACPLVVRSRRVRRVCSVSTTNDVGPRKEARERVW